MSEATVPCTTCGSCGVTTPTEACWITEDGSVECPECGYEN